MAENIHDVFWLTDLTRTTIIYVNPAYEEIWGRPCLGLYHDPRSWFEAVHIEDRAHLQQIMSRPVPDHGYKLDYRVVRPNGSVRWVSDREFPVRDDAGRFYRLVGIVRDVTAQKELEREILETSEREQRRIGQDLHDDLCQQLVGIEMLSKALERQLKEESHAGQAREIAEFIRAAIDHTRVLARGLSPFDLEADGLMKGLKVLAQRTSDLFRVECIFECPGPILIHDSTVGTNLYRIAQEGVTNSIKHGKARKIEIALKAEGDMAVLQVKDNGAGFTHVPKESKGMGLRIMQHRADTIGGTFAIEAEPAGGASLCCRVPLGRKPIKK
jgi:PAS domain S-box-containing protein